jgi:hypothetical protein
MRLWENQGAELCKRRVYVSNLTFPPGGIVKAEGLGDGSFAWPQDHRQPLPTQG